MADTKKGPSIPIGVRLVLLVVSIVVVVMLLSLVKNMLIMPLVNKHWVKTTNERCHGEEATPACDFTIGAIVVCNGHADDTATQVQQLFKRAWCPRRVVVVVVHFGPLVASASSASSSRGSALMSPSSATVAQRVAQHPMFMGIETEFNVAERIVSVRAEQQPTQASVLQGNIVALGMGLRKVRELKLQFACFLGPTAQAVANWDNVALEEFEAAAAGGKARPVLSYAPNKLNMAQATYPIIGFTGPHPSLNWHQFRHAPSLPHPNKLVSSDFLFTRLDFLPPALDSTFTRFPCPPRFADILLSQALLGTSLRLFAPCRLIVNGRFSTNCTRYLAAMNANDAAHALNESTTAAVLGVLRAAKYADFVTAFLGLDMAGHTVHMHTAMGSLPHTVGFSREVLEEDLHLKFDNTDNFNEIWGRVQRHVAITPARQGG